MSEQSAEKAHIALGVLTDLSERSTDGRLRDAIALVRSSLWDELDAHEVQEPAGQTTVSQDLSECDRPYPCCRHCGYHKEPYIGHLVACRTCHAPSSPPGQRP